MRPSLRIGREAGWLFGAWLLGFSGASTGAQEIETLWSQPPGYLVMTNSPQLQGAGRVSNFDWTTLLAGAPFTPPNAIVADDFRGDGRPVTRVRWWGAYQPGYEPPPGVPGEDGFALSFFGNAGMEPTQPRTLLATYLAPRDAVQAAPSPFRNAAGARIYQYEVALRDTLLDYGQPTRARPFGFFPASNGVHWISVAAERGLRVRAATNASGLITNWLREFTGNRAREHFWGWQTAPQLRGAASVSGQVRAFGTTNWWDLLYPTNRWMANAPLHGDSDQAFELDGGCRASAPRILSVTADCEAQLFWVVFDSPMDFDSTIDIANYLIFGEGERHLGVFFIGISGRRDAIYLMTLLKPLSGTHTLRAETPTDSCGAFWPPQEVQFPISCAPSSPPEVPPKLSMRWLPGENALGFTDPLAVLFWNHPAYQLEARSSLAPNEAWTPAGHTSPVLVLTTSEQRFFRLSRPAP